MRWISWGIKHYEYETTTTDDDSCEWELSISLVHNVLCFPRLIFCKKEITERMKKKTAFFCAATDFVYLCTKMTAI